MPKTAPKRVDREIERMKTLMQERFAAAGSVTDEDLRAEGFTNRQIGVLAERAASRAKAVFVKQL